MLNNNNKAVKIGILEISTQNKAILEFFFNNAGKSLFKEVASSNATAFIIDYDSLGAKENWESIYKLHNKPGIIISIHEVDLPSTVWVAKPLTAKALTEAGHKIIEMIAEAEPINNIALEIEEIEENQVVKKAKQTEQKKAEKEVAFAGETNFTSVEPPPATPKSKPTENTLNEIASHSPSPRQASATQPSIETDHGEIDKLLESLISGKGENHAKQLPAEDNKLESNSNSSPTETVDNEIVLEAPDIINEPLLEEGTVLAELADANSVDTNPTNDVNFETELPKVDDNDTNTIKQTIEIELPDEISVAPEIEETTQAISVTTAVQINDKDSAEDELQRLLEEIRNEADSNTLFTEVSKDSDGSYDEPFNTNAEKRWSLICGDLDKVTSTTDLKKNCYNPDNHLLAIFNEVLERSKSSKNVMRLKLGRTIIIVDVMNDTVYCDNSIMEDAYATLCYEPIKEGQAKIHALDESEVRMLLNKQKTDPDNSHSIESFVWTTSLLISRGRLPEKTDLKQQIGLKQWPNLTRLESFPHAIQIAAVFKKETGSLLEITKWLDHIPQSSIFAFYNGVLALDLMEQNREKLKSVKGDVKSPTNTKNRGFFSRLLNRITK